MKKISYFILIIICCIQYQGLAQQFGYTTWDNSRFFQSPYLFWWKIETGPSDSGEFTHLGFYQSTELQGADLFKMGIYEDNGSNNPGNKIVETSEFTAILDSYNQIELDTPVALDASTVHWVAFNCNVQTGFGELVSGSVALRYKSLSYGSAWPNPAGSVSGYTEKGGNIFAIGNGQIVLPVELIQFKVERKDEIPNLKWSTATEINNEGWNIQKSQNGFT